MTIKPRHILLLSLSAVCVVAGAQRVRTMRSTGTHARWDNAGTVEQIRDTAATDTAATATAGIAFQSQAVTLRGFSKRPSDKTETFFVTNNTGHRISRLTLRVQYFATDGAKLHERTVTVTCPLAPGETRQAQVRSFDTHSEFYYRTSPRLSKRAIPFTVKMRVLSYDVPVENPNALDP